MWLVHDALERNAEIQGPERHAQVRRYLKSYIFAVEGDSSFFATWFKLYKRYGFHVIADFCFVDENLRFLIFTSVLVW
jgi:hypothetical protein